MRIDVSGKGMELSERLRGHIQEKAPKLSKYFDKIQQLRFVVEGHPSGGVTVEGVVDVEGRDDFIARAEALDAQAAVDDCLHKLTRQLTDFKERLKTEHHRRGGSSPG